jgi:hypothetical protein
LFIEEEKNSYDMKLRYLTAVKLKNQRCPTHETGCGAHTIRDQDLGQKYLQKMLDTNVVVQSYTLLARAKMVCGFGRS